MRFGRGHASAEFFCSYGLPRPPPRPVHPPLPHSQHRMKALPLAPLRLSILTLGLPKSTLLLMRESASAAARTQRRGAAAAGRGARVRARADMVCCAVVEGAECAFFWT